MFSLFYSFLFFQASFLVALFSIATFYSFVFFYSSLSFSPRAFFYSGLMFSITCAVVYLNAARMVLITPP